MGISVFTNFDTKYSFFTLDISFVYLVSFQLYISIFSIVYFTLDFFYLRFVGLKSQWIISWN